ncbi:NAD(P)/FAD-dependent oxidoreductase [Pseudomonas entomophila]|uniref:NAD(P)/FAD-dependent oxidoreductase n=1 Tax=Pseudomonas entomophila TaxID=312306 RepID=UPI001F00FF51|nr:FAD-binding oxidoreductase [Pseudomonas entomophila]MCG8296021.1 FAD-binding oxidoreductase [Pseudomonas entomophila]
MKKPFDVIIVGAGIVGATCFHVLSQAGKRCLLLDEKQLACGITGASGCIVRVTHASREATAAAAEGYRFYQRLSAGSQGRVPFARTGYLHFAEVPDLDRMHGWLAEEGIGAELLDAQALAARFPALPISAELALLEPGSGYMDARPTLEYLVRAGITLGSVYQDAVTLHGIRVDGSGSRVAGVETSSGAFEAEHVVLAMGNGTPDFLARHFGDAFGLWNQHIQVTRFKGPTALATAPCFIDDVNDLNGRWCPLTGGFYVGTPTGLRVPASQAYAAASPAHAQLTRERGERRFPWLRTASAEGALCHSDCYSAQPIALLGEQPGLPGGVLVASGFSGGGFKMAPYAAMRVARVITQG